MQLSPYDPARHREGLWDCKRGFETGLGETGDASKAAAYEAKLTDDYRREWLAWVRRCTDENPRCVTVAEAESSDPGATDVATDTGGDSATVVDTDAATTEEAEEGDDAPEVVGYVFLLPESLAYVWDAAVVNEIYVRPAHRGTGTADELLDAGLAVARDQSLPLDRLVLDVDRSNERARAFYERHGFEHWGEMLARPVE